MALGDMLQALGRRIVGSPLIEPLVNTLESITSNLPGPKSLAKIGILSSFVNNNAQYPVHYIETCLHPGVSCPAELPPDLDTCCLNHPSGHFLSTQFWDTSPPLGADDVWTIHGLWPDLCTGGFQQFCAQDRSYNNISDILKATSASDDLLTFMNENWLSINGDNEHLWSHEWNKHGTCISTLEPTCYGSSPSPFLSVLDYFTHATSLYRTLPTYSTLAAHDITPSHTQTYSLSALQSAISSSHQDHPVTFRCNSRHELTEIWYHFSVRGPLRNANAALLSQSSSDLFVPADPDGAKSNCPANGIKYLPKSPDSRPTPSSTLTATTSTSHPTSTSTSTAPPFSGKGHLMIRPKSDSSSSQSSDPQFQGCLIRSGHWYTSGGCATYLAKPDVTLTDPPLFSSSGIDAEAQTLFTLSSLYYPCAILLSSPPSPIPQSHLPPMDAETAFEAGEFKCGKDLGVQTIFSANYPPSASSPDEKVLAYKNSTTFYAAKIPGRFEQVTIYASAGGDGDGERSVEVEIYWRGI